MHSIDFLNLALLIILIILVLFALNKISSALNQKLSNVQGEFTQHLTSSVGTLNNITERLTELKLSSDRILEVGKNIQSLQDILKPPKLRGNLGELLLEQLLSQILPPKYYQCFYKFNSGQIVDAVVKLKDSKLVCIDAKFPLESIKEYISGNSAAREEIPSQFFRDVKKHIDSISSKYILPEEGTLDFAFMYIPAEAVFYEILNDEKIIQYARGRNVIPVSPLSFYSYLSTVLIGLRGLEVEENIKQVLGKISDLKALVNFFYDDFKILGNHLTNAKSKFDDSLKTITSVSSKLENIEIAETRNEFKN